MAAAKKFSRMGATVTATVTSANKAAELSALSLNTIVLKFPLTNDITHSDIFFVKADDEELAPLTQSNGTR